MSKVVVDSKLDLDTYIKLLQACQELSMSKDEFTSLEVEDITGIDQKECSKYFFVDESFCENTNAYFKVKYMILNRKNGKMSPYNLRTLEFLKELEIQGDIVPVVKFSNFSR